MEFLHQEFLKTLNKIIEKNPERADKLDIEQIMADVTPEAVRSIICFLSGQAGINSFYVSNQRGIRR